jgi:hypothetical protein
MRKVTCMRCRARLLPSALPRHHCELRRWIRRMKTRITARARHANVATARVLDTAPPLVAVREMAAAVRSKGEVLPLPARAELAAGARPVRRRVTARRRAPWSAPHLALARSVTR